MPKFQTVALVDDSEADNYLHRMLLEEAGLAERIEVFSYAEEALGYLRSDDRPGVDLILLDINMPRMDGFEFMHEYVKLDPERKGAWVIMLSTSLSDEDRERAESHPEIRGFVSKPLTLQRLEEIMDSEASGSA